MYNNAGGGTIVVVVITGTYAIGIPLEYVNASWNIKKWNSIIDANFYLTLKRYNEIIVVNVLSLCLCNNLNYLLIHDPQHLENLRFSWVFTVYNTLRIELFQYHRCTRWLISFSLDRGDGNNALFMELHFYFI